VARPRGSLVARVVILRDGGRELLAARHREDDGGEFWCLPGGKLQAGERFDHAAVRELREEAGVEVELGGVVWVQELTRLDRFELFFAAQTVAGTPVQEPTVGDRHLVGLAWRRLDELAGEDFRPAGLVDVLLAGELAEAPYASG
jgi:8-oxo-dGTP pyrophosphatase MutT (NUDIX family)